MPGQKLMDARDGHVGQPGEDIGEPSLWVDIVHFRCDDQGIHGGRPLTATLGTREEPIFPFMQRFP
jgi:hypothetical protein